MARLLLALGCGYGDRMTKRPASVSMPEQRPLLKRFAEGLISLDDFLKSELRPLRLELDRGPRQGEAIDQFVERLFHELEEILEQLATYLPGTDMYSVRSVVRILL